MLTKLPMSSPIYEAYIVQKDIFDSAIDAAINESASKMTKAQLSQLFSICGYAALERKAA